MPRNTGSLAHLLSQLLATNVSVLFHQFGNGGTSHCAPQSASFHFFFFRLLIIILCAWFGCILLLVILVPWILVTGKRQTASAKWHETCLCLFTASSAYFQYFLSPSFPTHGNDRIRWERQQFPSTFCVAIKAAKHVVLVCASIIMHNWAMSRLVSSVLVIAVLCVFCLLHANGRFLNSAAEWQKRRCWCSEQSALCVSLYWWQCVSAVV